MRRGLRRVKEPRSPRAGDNGGRGWLQKGKRNLSLVPLGAGGGWHTDGLPEAGLLPLCISHWAGCPLGEVGGYNFSVICGQDGSWPEKDAGVSCQSPVSTKARHRQGEG